MIKAILFDAINWEFLGTKEIKDFLDPRIAFNSLAPEMAAFSEY